MEQSRWAPQPSAPPASYRDDATPFAQTGGEASDLFSDDFTPIAQPVIQPVPPEAPRSNIPHFANPRGDRDGRQARGRGRGARAAPPPLPSPTKHNDDGVDAAQDTTEAGSEPLNTGPTPSKPNASAAVRGDRSHTGGPTRTRLTEEELSAKLEAVRLNNAKREEAHRAAEADEANFKAQEQQAQERRKEDTLNRRRMEAEREKNRARKMAGRGGREWDEGKEEDSGRGRGRGHRRGANGAIQGLPTSTHGGDSSSGRASWAADGSEATDDRYGGGHGSRPGRLGRGRGRGRGRAQDGVGLGRSDARGPPPSLGTFDFPALGGAGPAAAPHESQDAGDTISASKEDRPSAGKESKLEAPHETARSRHTRSPWRVADEPKTSWADQVEDAS